MTRGMLSILGLYATRSTGVYFSDKVAYTKMRWLVSAMHVNKGLRMAFHHVIGQHQATFFLQKVLASERIAQAYLFYGPSGVGKKFAALQFTKALHCSSISTDACDLCPSCRRIDAGNHPDVVIIGPEGNAIRIEQIRALQRQLNYKPYESQRTTMIIDGCELLTLPARNALLKTLEEPPYNTFLVLLTSKKDALPLTIVSRCQLVVFRPLSAPHICTILQQQGVEPNLATVAATLAEGRLDTFPKHDIAQILAHRQDVYTMLEDLATSHALAVFTKARQIAAKREQCEDVLHWLGLFCRDMVLLKTDPTRPLYNQDLSAQLATIARAFSVAGLLETFHSLEHYRSLLHMNINPQLIFENLVLQLQKLLTAPPTTAA
jgi:DNA polymerase III subunit delta'